MNTMKILSKLLIATSLISIVVVSSCDPTKNAASDPYTNINTQNIGQGLMIADTVKVKRSQFNEICTNENIPNDLLLWGNIVMRNDGDGKRTMKWMYINDESSVFNVRLDINEKNDTTFIVETRKTNVCLE